MGVVNAIPSGWHSVMKGNVFTTPSPLNESCYFLSVKAEIMDILNMPSKNVYKEFSSCKSTPPTAQAKWEDKYPSPLDEWTKNILFAFSGFSGCKAKGLPIQIFKSYCIHK